MSPNESILDQSPVTQLGKGSLPLKIAVISSFVPKKCGIATFSRDLIDGLSAANPGTQVVIIAAETGNEQFDYDERVVGTINTTDRASYRAAGELLNQLNPDIVLLQHEYGLYGGSFTNFEKDGVKHSDPIGDFIFDLLEVLKAPIMTTLHTILAAPDNQRREVLARLAAISLVTVAMTHDSRDLLVEHYGVSKDKVVVIPHGVPQVEADANVRAELGIDPKANVLTITGLIGENKGVDIAISALPEILKAHPNTLLYVVGQTHPNILAHAGEAYRERLCALAAELGVSSQVVWVNRYLSTPKLMCYMQASSVYLTLHRDPEQAASGTLAYALGAGLVSVSTPYRYAEEVLADGRGFLVPFEDVAATAKTLIRILSDRKLFQQTRDLAGAYGKEMAWPLVGEAYLKLAQATKPA